MAGPYLPVQALNRSQKVRLGKGSNAVLLQPGVTSYVDISDGNIKRDLQRHSAIGAILIVGGLTYRQGSATANGILSNALTANSSAINTTETLVLNVAIPANTLAVGSVLDIEAMGTATVTGNLTANVRLGTAGTVAGDTSVAASATVAAAAAAWRLDVEGEVRSIGAGTSASLAANARLTIGTATLAHGTVATTTFNSTVQNFIDLSFVCTSSATVTVQNANIKVFL